MLKTCPQCGEEFKTYRTAAIYCDKACHNASMVRAKTYTCTRCGVEFQRPSYVMKKPAKNHFCTAKCHTQWMKANARRVNCKVCGKEFQHSNRRVFHCSWECRNVGLRTGVKIPCQNCGNEFRTYASYIKIGRRFCSNECARSFRVGPNHHNYRGGAWLKHGSRWQEIRRKVIARDNACRVCGATSNPSGRELHVHHRKPRREYVVQDMANEMDNLFTLCASCHLRIEMKITHNRGPEIPSFLRPPA